MATDVARPHGLDLRGKPTGSTWRTKLAAVSDLIRLPKQYGTLLLMAPALWSLVIASNGRPSWRLLAVFVMGAFVMRSAGCVLNDLADRHIDGRVQRTKERPLASGRLTPGEALAVGAALSFVALLLALTLNPLAIALSVVGFVLAAVYPLMKRVIAMPQAVMGAAFGWGALLAWAAVRNEVGAPAVVIFLATVCWAAGYDTIYAMLDRDDDLKIGVRSSAILFGPYAWAGVGVLFAFSVAGLVVLGMRVPMGGVYHATIAAVAAVLAYQTWRLRREIDHAAIFALFRSHAWIGLVVLLGIIVDLGMR
ncbi:MAG: 4-hydroxybenzoate octaprenyltransferase [Nitrospirota bacterium]